jgi:integrase
MKAGREHAIPLSDAAVRVLNIVSGLHKQWVFPNLKKNTSLSNMAMLEVLRDMNGYKDKVSKKPIVVHGFRSTFRTWASEATNFPAEIAEAALALLCSPCPDSSNGPILLAIDRHVACNDH